MICIRDNERVFHFWVKMSAFRFLELKLEIDFGRRIKLKTGFKILQEAAL